MTKNEFELMFIRSNIDFISVASKFLVDKKCNREFLARLYELKGTDCDDSVKLALLMVEHVLAELMRENDDKLFENIGSELKKKKEKEEISMSNPIEELMSVTTDEQVKEDKSYSWKPQTVEQCVKRKDLWKIPPKGGVTFSKVLGIMLRAERLKERFICSLLPPVVVRPAQELKWLVTSLMKAGRCVI